MKRGKREIIHLDPDRALPVVLALAELGMRRRQAAEAVRGPEMCRVPQQVKNRTQVGRVWREKREKEGEEREVALVAHEVGFILNTWLRPDGEQWKQELTFVIDVYVTVHLVLLTPVQVLQIIQDSFLNRHK